MKSDPKEPTTTPSVTAFSEAFLSAPRNPLALLFALASVCFGTEAFQMFREGMPLGNYVSVATDALSNHPLLTFLILPGYLASAFFRTALLFSLSGAGGAGPRIGKVLRRTGRVLPRILLLETSLLLSLFFLAALLLAPSLLTGAAALSETLRLSGILLFLLIGITLLFTAAYATLFIAFSDTPLSSAIGLGYELLRKRPADSLLFGALLAIFGMTVSLLVSGILPVVAMTAGAGGVGTALSLILVLTVLSPYTAIRKKAWILFFFIIARPKDGPESPETSQNGEKVIQREVPETGQASVTEVR